MPPQAIVAVGGPSGGGDIHGMHQGHVRSHVTFSIKRSLYLHSAHPLMNSSLAWGRAAESPRAKPPGKESSMLVLYRKLGEKVVIGDRIVVTVVKLDRGQVRLGIEAPPEIAVAREEIYPRLHTLPLVQPIV